MLIKKLLFLLVLLLTHITMAMLEEKAGLHTLIITRNSTQDEQMINSIAYKTLKQMISNGLQDNYKQQTMVTINQFACLKFVNKILHYYSFPNDNAVNHRWTKQRIGQIFLTFKQYKEYKDLHNSIYVLNHYCSSFQYFKNHVDTDLSKKNQQKIPDRLKYFINNQRPQVDFFNSCDTFIHETSIMVNSKFSDDYAQKETKKNGKKLLKTVNQIITQKDKQNHFVFPWYVRHHTIGYFYLILQVFFIKKMALLGACFYQIKGLFK